MLKWFTLLFILIKSIFYFKSLGFTIVNDDFILLHLVNIYDLKCLLQLNKDLSLTLHHQDILRGAFTLLWLLRSVCLQQNVKEKTLYADIKLILLSKCLYLFVVFFFYDPGLWKTWSMLTLSSLVTLDPFWLMWRPTSNFSEWLKAINQNIWLFKTN